MNEPLMQQFKQIGLQVGSNGLPYHQPIHPNLVHLTLGLFIIAILFDWAGTLFPLGKPVLRFLSLPTLRSSFYDVGWYNLVAAAGITFFTVAVGLFELLLADPLPNQTSAWGLDAGSTMLLHGVGGVILLGIIVGLTIWRGWQRYQRHQRIRQVQWSYLALGAIMLGVLFIHGTLGAQLGEDFGVHNTAVLLLRDGQNPNTVLKVQ
jgi:uncharacterized membrane protein